MFDTKMARFRERWLGEIIARQPDPSDGMTSSLAGRPCAPAPGLVFRERLAAPSRAGRGGRNLSPPRLRRALRWVCAALAATALAAAGLYQVFRYAPQEVEALSTALSRQDRDPGGP